VNWEGITRIRPLIDGYGKEVASSEIFLKKQNMEHEEENPAGQKKKLRNFLGKLQRGRRSLEKCKKHQRRRRQLD